MRFLSVILLSFIITNGFSQVNGGSIEKLQKLYEEGKYESCLFRADNYTYKEAYSKDPEPLLYIAMCFYNLAKSDDEFIREDYADGVKESIKYASKFAKKDKDDKLYSKNGEFINKLKEEQRELLVNYLNRKQYSKASSMADKYNDLNREIDYTVVYMSGVYSLLGEDTKGNSDIEEAYTKLNSVSSVVVDPIVRSQIIDSFLKYSELLVKDGKVAAAKKQLDLAKKIFPNDGYINMQHNMIAKSLSK